MLACCVEGYPSTLHKVYRVQRHHPDLPWPSGDSGAAGVDGQADKRLSGAGPGPGDRLEAPGAGQKKHLHGGEPRLRFARCRLATSTAPSLFPEFSPTSASVPTLLQHGAWVARSRCWLLGW